MQLTEAECHSPSTVLDESVAKDYTTGLSRICREGYQQMNFTKLLEILYRFFTSLGSPVNQH